MWFTTCKRSELCAVYRVRAKRVLRGDCSSMVERRPVEADVAGSSPVSHPNILRMVNARMS